MPAKLQNVLRSFLGQALPSSLTKLSKPRKADLTQSSWAKLIRFDTEVPKTYKSFFAPMLAKRDAFPYTILIPRYERYYRRQAEKLICDLGSEIYILEKCEDTFDVECFPIRDIIYTEFSSALLVSSIKICGLSNQEVYASSTFTFNSVTDCLFMPILQHARLFAIESQDIVSSLELKKFDYLAIINYKFMNFAKNSLLEGETVIHSVFQSEIQARIPVFWSNSLYRTIDPTHMTILTNRELILLSEDARYRREDRYGGIRNYIPLNKIISLSMHAKENDLSVLTIQLPQNIFFEILFQVSADAEIRKLLDCFKALTAR